MWCWDNPTARGDGKPWGQEYSALHEGGGNLVFADGHAEFRNHRDLRARDFGLTGGPGVGGKEDDRSTTPHGQRTCAGSSKSVWVCGGTSAGRVNLRPVGKRPFRRQSY